MLDLQLETPSLLFMSGCLDSKKVLNPKQEPTIQVLPPCPKGPIWTRATTILGMFFLCLLFLFPIFWINIETNYYMIRYLILWSLLTTQVHYYDVFSWWGQDCNRVSYKNCQFMLYKSKLVFFSIMMRFDTIASILVKRDVICFKLVKRHNNS